MKILVVGGAGYLGSVLVPYLLSKDFSVNVLDLFLYGDHTLEEHKNLNIFKGDVRNIDLVSKSMKDCDIVIHLACISNDPSFELNPRLGKSINYDSFEPLVKEARKAGVAKFIYASSSSVYGINDAKDVNEKTDLKPLTDYSKFKVACEEILNSYRSENFIVTSVRSATLCGYSKRQRLDLIVNIFINHAFNNKKIKIFGGDQLRPNIHVKDIAEFYYHLIKFKEDHILNGQSFNVGYENYPISEIADLVKKNFKDKIEIEKISSDDIRSYHISSKKAFEVLGYKAKKPLTDAIKDLTKAFEDKKLTNPLENEMYYNIKRMKNINLV